MSKIERFEDLVAWQKARLLASTVHRTTTRRPFARDYPLRNQIYDSAISVASNIAEGFERYGPREFAYFLGVARASCGEVRSHLYMAFDAGYIDEPTLTELTEQARDCGMTVGRLRSAVIKRIQKLYPGRTPHSALRTQRPCS